MRKPMTIAAVALALLAVPASANWNTTRWGMTPEQVIAAFPGAVATEATKGSDVKGMHQLATAPWKDGDVAMEAAFLFGADGLAFVGLRVSDTAQCAAYKATLIVRHGAGKVMGRELGGLTFGKVEWVDPASHDRLMFSYILKPDQSYSICKFISEKP